jgi:hypothetical protein
MHPATQLLALQEELAAQREELAEERRRWEARHEESLRRLDELAQRAETLMTELDRSEEPAEPAVVEMPQDAAESTPVVLLRSSEPAVAATPLASRAAPKPDSPVNLAEIFQRMNLDVVADDDEQLASVEKSPTRPAPPARHAEPEIKRPAVEPAHEASGDEESIDDYMARLLSRVREGNSAEPNSRPSASAQSRPVPQRSATTPAPIAPSAAAVPSQAPVRRPGPVTMTPRAVAPEKQVNLSAMRELANLSAQMAITRYADREFLSITRTKLAVAAAGVAVGGVLIWLWTKGGSKHVNLYGALGSFLIAVLWGGQYALLRCRRLLRRIRHQPEPQATEPTAGPPAELTCRP